MISKFAVLLSLLPVEVLIHSSIIVTYHFSSQLLLWHGCWFWRYKVKKAPYSWEDASYLTRRSLGARADAWRNLGNDCLLIIYPL